MDGHARADFLREPIFEKVMQQRVTFFVKGRSWSGNV